MPVLLMFVVTLEIINLFCLFLAELRPFHADLGRCHGASLLSRSDVHDWSNADINIHPSSIMHTLTGVMDILKRMR